MRTLLRAATALAAMLTMMASTAQAVELKVMASAAVKDAYNEVIPAFEASSGHKVVTEWVPTVEMMKRLGGGEAPDLVVMAAAGIDKLTADGKFVAGSKLDIAKSGIGVGIRKGAPKPDISTVDALKKTLIAAKSVAYSTGPSGVYLAQMMERLGLTAELKPKLKVIQGEPVGDVVARGDAEIGFQQVPELLPVKGLDYIGTLPAEVQQITTFSAAVPTGAKQGDAARALAAFLRTPAAVTAIRKTGMEPG